MILAQPPLLPLATIEPPLIELRLQPDAALRPLALFVDGALLGGDLVEGAPLREDPWRN
jgi:hypothetical protein